MSGHSKWSTIKRKKGAADAARGKVFSRLSKEITVAAKLGGGDPDGNPRLRAAIATAKSANMPNANIDRAVDKGAGGANEEDLEEIMYEGYGPNGASLMIEVMTDNRNRIAGEVRHIFSKRDCTLAELGAVAWKFNRKGQMMVEQTDDLDEDTIMMAALEAGAEDVIDAGGAWEILTDPSDLYKVSDALEASGFKPEEVRLAMIPTMSVPLEGRDAEVMLNLVEALEDNDDVQCVYGDYEISDEELERLNA